MSKKLLLADDSITIQKVIQITFAHEDYELTITDNGDTALTKAREIVPDLVLADVYMPGKNGYELATAIKQDPALQHVPVLLLAGSFEPFDEDKARSCMADAWIEKPFESQSLIDKVAELLSASRQTATPAAAPEPVGEPAGVAEFAFEETPLTAFAESFDAGPAMATAPEDPFGDISFEEEVPAAEAEPVSAADDWGDVLLDEPGPADPAVLSEEPAFDAAEDFSFAEEEPAALAAEVFEPAEAAPSAGAEFDAFALDDEEIMPLGDDDILSAEDLEPVMEEQTLAPWSRAATDEEDMFAEPLEEEPGVAAPVFGEEPVFEPEPTLGEEPVADDVPVAGREPAAKPDAGALAAALGEEDLERIVEKVVTQIVEKLAGSILERVAWEVVPDLAESLIREEIRKIKDAAA